MAPEPVLCVESTSADVEAPPPAPRATAGASAASAGARGGGALRRLRPPADLEDAATVEVCVKNTFICVAEAPPADRLRRAQSERGARGAESASDSAAARSSASDLPPTPKGLDRSVTGEWYDAAPLECSGASLPAAAFEAVESWSAAPPGVWDMECPRGDYGGPLLYMPMMPFPGLGQDDWCEAWGEVWPCHGEQLWQPLTEPPPWSACDVEAEAEAESAEPAPGVLGVHRLSSPGARVQRFRWTADARKLASSTRKAVSPAFLVRLPGPVPPARIEFKIFVRPDGAPEGRGGCSFRTSRGRGCLELHCLQLPEGGGALPVQFRFRVGSEPARDPVRHDFSVQASCGLPPPERWWDLVAAVDPASDTFAVHLDVVAGEDLAVAPLGP